MSAHAPVPLPSLEVRWYFRGPVSAHETLLHWFEQARPSSVGAPEWKGRKGGKPDLYLLVPGRDDLGIKWREGELQLKGRVSDLGLMLFDGGHHGRVERWIKWSVPGLPAPWRDLFEADADGIKRIAVAKTRALRKIHLPSFGGEAQEVAASTAVDRGIAMELTELTVNDAAWCSLAFEAFPDDSGLDAAFHRVVSEFVVSLRGVSLSPDNSLSYPAWLGKLST